MGREFDFQAPDGRRQSPLAAHLQAQLDGFADVLQRLLLSPALAEAPRDDRAFDDIPAFLILVQSDRELGQAGCIILRWIGAVDRARLTDALKLLRVDGSEQIFQEGFALFLLHFPHRRDDLRRRQYHGCQFGVLFRHAGLRTLPQYTVSRLVTFALLATGRPTSQRCTTSGLR